MHINNNPTAQMAKENPMTKDSVLSLCVIISGIALIASATFGLPGQGILASCFGAFIGIRIGVYLLGRFKYNFETRYKELYMVANSALSSYGEAVIFNIKTMTHDIKPWPIPTPSKENVLSTAEPFIPRILESFTDFKEIVYGIVAHIGSEALSKQAVMFGSEVLSDNVTYKLHMLKLMQDQAVRDCAGIWLRREGRQNLRISVDNIMHVYFEWIDPVVDGIGHKPGPEQLGNGLQPQTTA